MLKVNEIFGPTIQGEGKSAGMPCAFLRLSLCNLHCIWCDTPYTWNWLKTPFLHPDKFDKEKELHVMTDDEIIESLKKIDVKSLVISGGEPLLQFKDLTPLLRKLNGYWIEVETNGTIWPGEEFLSLVNQINCSPKLSNSGNETNLRIRGNVLVKLAESPKTTFKFVISSPQDVDEVLELVKTYDMKQVYLMPLGKYPKELEQTTKLVQDLCEKHNFIFSDRLHVKQFGGVRGV